MKTICLDQSEIKRVICCDLRFYLVYEMIDNLFLDGIMTHMIGTVTEGMEEI